MAGFRTLLATTGLWLALSATTLSMASELRFGVSDLPRSQGNPFTESGTPSGYTWAALFDGLTRLDAEGKLVPALAEDWEQVDAHTWRFQLRQDVRFTNGEEFNAAAVAATLAWLQSPEGRSTLIGNEVRGIVDVTTRGDYRIDITTATPDAILPQRMSAVMIVAPGAWQRLGPEGFAREPAGTGPYRMAEWDNRRRRVRLERHPESWRPPSVETLHLVALPDNAVRVQALRSGEVDLTLVDIEDIEFLARQGFRVLHRPSMQVMALAFNTAREPPSPVRDLRVRQAINLAVNRQAIAEVLMQGLVAPAGQPAARITPGHNPELPAYPYDPERARALLAEAGWEHGLELRIEAVTGTLPGASQIFQVVVQDLRRVGVNATLQLRPFSAWLRDYLGGTTRADLFSLPWTAAPYNDPLRPIETYSCALRAAFFCEPEVMPAIAEIAAELDPERRTTLLQDLAVTLHDIAPALFLIEQIVIYATNERVEHLEIANRTPVYDTLRSR